MQNVAADVAILLASSVENEKRACEKYKRPLTGDQKLVLNIVQVFSTCFRAADGDAHVGESSSSPLAVCFESKQSFLASHASQPQLVQCAMFPPCCL